MAGNDGEDSFFVAGGIPESIFGDAGRDFAVHDADDIFNSIEDQMTGS
jgi:hypothetical protein